MVEMGQAGVARGDASRSLHFANAALTPLSSNCTRPRCVRAASFLFMLFFVNDNKDMEINGELQVLLDSYTKSALTRLATSHAPGSSSWRSTLLKIRTWDAERVHKEADRAGGGGEDLDDLTSHVFAAYVGDADFAHSPSWVDMFTQWIAQLAENDDVVTGRIMAATMTERNVCMQQIMQMALRALRLRHTRERNSPVQPDDSVSMAVNLNAYRDTVVAPSPAAEPAPQTNEKVVVADPVPRFFSSIADF